MDDMNVIVDLFKTVGGSFGAGAWMLGISSLLFGLIKVIRLKTVQKLLGMISEKLTWDSWPKWVCKLVVCGVSGIAAFLGAMATGVPWLAAIPVAISAVLGAMGIDQLVSPAKEVAKVNP